MIIHEHVTLLGYNSGYSGLVNSEELEELAVRICTLERQATRQKKTTIEESSSINKS